MLNLQNLTCAFVADHLFIAIIKNCIICDWFLLSIKMRSQ